MKRYLQIISASCLLLASLSACQEEYITYKDAEYVMFADTVSTYVIREDITSFDVPVSSTVACSYDRHFAVEIIDTESSAIEGRHFSLASNNITIPAGKLTANVTVNSNIDILDPDEDMYIKLKLVIPDDKVFQLYGDETTVNIKRSCKFKRENFCGWAVVTSLFLYDYSSLGNYQRLIRTSPDPNDENGVILHDFIADGYDVKISFDDDTDPMNPSINCPAEQVVSDEAQFFGTVYGDNHILMDQSPYGVSYFFGCEKVAVLVNQYYVQKIGENIGTVGNYLTEIDWVSDAEAERLRIEDGL